MKKTTARISLGIVFILQSIFLAAIWAESTSIPAVLALMALIALLTVLSWRKIPHHDHDHLWEDTWLIVFVGAGAVITFWLSRTLHHSPVIAAGTVGLLASFIPSVWPKTSWSGQIPPATYCGAFVGMTSPKVAGDYPFILLAAGSAGILLMLSKNVFHGYGGKLGTIAFGGVALIAVLIKIFLS